MPALRRAKRGLTAADIAGVTNSRLAGGGAPGGLITNIAALATAGLADLVFVDDKRHIGELAQTRAGACVTSPQFAGSVPPGIAVLLSEEPYRAFVAAARALFPEALRPTSLFGTSGRADGVRVHPSARIEAGVTLDPLAVIGPGAEVGSGTVVAAGAVIGPEVCVGRYCAIGAGATVLNALIGDRVTLHAGARLGDDGPVQREDLPGLGKVPLVRRVIVQDGVEVGANAAIDRGSLRDTVVGEGTRIGNLVHVGHGTVIGRHCLIGAQSGLAGGVTMGDFVVINDRAGVAENIAIGDGASVARGSMVSDNLGSGARFAAASEPSRSGL